MSNYRRAKTAGGSYFFTLVSYQRRSLLTDQALRMALRQAINQTRQQYPFAIDGWVLLPDHLHCVWTLPQDDADYAIRWAKIKRHVSRECGSRYTISGLSASKKKRHEAGIWQRRYWEHQIRDDKDFEHHLDYLHWNPVKHGLVRRVIDWPYSSFHRYLKQGMYTEEWAGVAEEGDYGE